MRYGLWWIIDSQNPGTILQAICGVTGNVCLTVGLLPSVVTRTSRPMIVEGFLKKRLAAGRSRCSMNQSVTSCER